MARKTRTEEIQDLFARSAREYEQKHGHVWMWHGYGVKLEGNLWHVYHLRDDRAPRWITKYSTVLEHVITSAVMTGRINEASLRDGLPRPTAEPEPAPAESVPARRDSLKQMSFIEREPEPTPEPGEKTAMDGSDAQAVWAIFKRLGVMPDPFNVKEQPRLNAFGAPQVLVSARITGTRQPDRDALIAALTETGYALITVEVRNPAIGPHHSIYKVVRNVAPAQAADPAPAEPAPAQAADPAPAEAETVTPAMDGLHMRKVKKLLSANERLTRRPGFDLALLKDEAPKPGLTFEIPADLFEAVADELADNYVCAEIEPQPEDFSRMLIHIMPIEDAVEDEEDASEPPAETVPPGGTDTDLRTGVPALDIILGIEPEPAPVPAPAPAQDEPAPAPAESVTPAMDGSSGDMPVDLAAFLWMWIRSNRTFEGIRHGRVPKTHVTEQGHFPGVMALRRLGYTSYRDGSFAITEAGRQALARLTPLGGEKLRTVWKAIKSNREILFPPKTVPPGGHILSDESVPSASDSLPHAPAPAQDEPAPAESVRAGVHTLPGAPANENREASMYSSEGEASPESEPPAESVPAASHTFAKTPRPPAESVRGAAHTLQPAPTPAQGRRCAICGASMEGKRPQAKTCSDPCRKRLSRIDQEIAAMRGHGSPDLYYLREASKVDLLADAVAERCKAMIEDLTEIMESVTTRRTG